MHFKDSAKQFTILSNIHVLNDKVAMNKEGPLLWWKPHKTNLYMAQHLAGQKPLFSNIRLTFLLKHNVYKINQ